MSVGFFFGIRHSYIDDAVVQAERLHAAVNEVLRANGLPTTLDPERCQDPRGDEAGPLGRSGLDHHGGRSLAALGELAGSAHPHLQLLAFNPYRVVYAPRALVTPDATSHTEEVWDQTVRINVGSTSWLLAEVLDIAPMLGIPLDGGALSDDVARRIDAMEPLHDDDTTELVDDLRTAWLLVHEAARLTLSVDVCLALAG